MKQKLFLISILCCALQFATAQAPNKRKGNIVPRNANAGLIILVIDRQTGMPIENVRITARELGFEAQQTGTDGLVVFTNVPSGEGHFTILKQGYRKVDTVFTASTRQEDNTYTVNLVANKAGNTLLIAGKIEDNEGRNVRDASVEVEIGDFKQEAISSETGSYRIILNMDKVVHEVSEILFSVTKNGCAYKDKLQLPRTNYISKDIRLYCPDEEITVPQNNLGTPNNNNNAADNLSNIQATSGVRIRLLSARSIQGFVELNMQVENVSKENDEIDFRLKSYNGGKAIGSNGIEYVYYRTSIGGSNDMSDNSATLYKKVPVKITVFYSTNNKPKPSNITMLTQPLEINMQQFTLRLSNLRLGN